MCVGCIEDDFILYRKSERCISCSPSSRTFSAEDSLIATGEEDIDGEIILDEKRYLCYILPLI